MKLIDGCLKEDSMTCARFIIKQQTSTIDVWSSAAVTRHSQGMTQCRSGLIVPHQSSAARYRHGRCVVTWSMSLAFRPRSTYPPHHRPRCRPCRRLTSPAAKHVASQTDVSVSLELPGCKTSARPFARSQHAVWSTERLSVNSVPQATNFPTFVAKLNGHLTALSAGIAVRHALLTHSEAIVNELSQLRQLMSLH